MKPTIAIDELTEGPDPQSGLDRLSLDALMRLLTAHQDEADAAADSIVGGSPRPPYLAA